MITHSPRASATLLAISLPPSSSTTLAPGAARPATTARPSGPIRATSKLGIVTASGATGEDAGGRSADGGGCSVSLPRHATARATAMTTAPPPTSQKTVRDITLPTVRRPTALGVATPLGEMIPCHPGPERHRIDCKKKPPCPPPCPPPILPPYVFFAAPASAPTLPRAKPPYSWVACWPANA